MKQEFNNATEMLEIINKNRQLTADNFSKQNAEKLGMQIWNTIQPYVQENLSIYQNWKKQNYAQRKKFISDILNLLLDKFPSDNTTTKQLITFFISHPFGSVQAPCSYYIDSAKACKINSFSMY